MSIMPEVTPSEWTDVSVLYDDGKYIAIWGRFRGNRRCLGVRWSGTDPDTVAVSNALEDSMWYVEPRFLQEKVLLGLLQTLLTAPATTDTRKYIQNIFAALREAA